jgi:hypothetical protein
METITLCDGQPVAIHVLNKIKKNLIEANEDSKKIYRYKMPSDSEFKSYTKQPFLIHRADGSYKVVSKDYILYKMRQDEYETETEMEEENFTNEFKRIQEKYNKK